jgi:large subunit ribosomal protein L9
MMVDVILLERVENLGHMGQVVKVRPGYARNFLLPQKKALRATKDNLKYFESQRAQLEANNLKLKAEAEQVAGKMTGLSVVMIRQAGETGQLYGSVSARDVADAVTESGFTVERSQVALDHPIKTLGLHKIKVSLHPEVSLQVIVNVALTPEEAAAQARGLSAAEIAAAADAEDEAEVEAEAQESDETEAWIEFWRGRGTAGGKLRRPWKLHVRLALPSRPRWRSPIIAWLRTIPRPSRPCWARCWSTTRPIAGFRIFSPPSISTIRRISASMPRWSG